MYRYRLKATIHNRYRVRTMNSKQLLPWPVTLCVGIFVACGFVYVTWQHVEAVQIRLESAALRRQKASLDQAERRLMVERNQKQSLETVELVARPFGYVMPRPEQTVSVEIVAGTGRR